MNERERIRRLVDRFGAAPLVVPSGDDAAVVDPAGRLSVSSVDAAVDGVHFRRGLWPVEAIARKAVGPAVSDLAAMGAEPGELFIAAGLPEDFTGDEFEALVDGIAAAADECGCSVAGGDLVAADQLWLSVTAVGYAAGTNAIVTRGGAAAGDLVVVTGALGGAARALELIDHGQTSDPAALQKQFAPQPRLAGGQALARAGASAMIDISDGLAADAGHIAAASRARLTLRLDDLPLARGVEDAAAAAASGEEYELLATLPAAALAAALAGAAEADLPLTVIGEVSAGSGAVLVDALGDEVEIGGFDHFD